MAAQSPTIKLHTTRWFRAGDSSGLEIASREEFLSDKLDLSQIAFKLSIKDLRAIWVGTVSCLLKCCVWLSEHLIKSNLLFRLVAHFFSESSISLRSLSDWLCPLLEWFYYLWRGRITGLITTVPLKSTSTSPLNWFWLMASFRTWYQSTRMQICTLMKTMILAEVRYIIRLYEFTEQLKKFMTDSSSLQVGFASLGI